MGIRMVRQPSETPNVTNIDDIIPFRYAYGNQNGYVKNRGMEISHTIDGNTFRINSGRIVLQGVETDIDANGISFTIDNASETRYYVIYYEVNLGTQTTAIKLSNYSTTDFPTIDAGDDLTANSSGVARMELYRFTTSNGVISDVRLLKTAQPIEYYGSNLLKDYLADFSITQQDKELYGIEFNIGDTLEFQLASNSSIGGINFNTTDNIALNIVQNMFVWKRLNSCEYTGNSLDAPIGKETYINIKESNGKLYIRGYLYDTLNKTTKDTSVRLRSVYRVKGV